MFIKAYSSDVAMIKFSMHVAEQIRFSYIFCPDNIVFFHFHIQINFTIIGINMNQNWLQKAIYETPFFI